MGTIIFRKHKWNCDSETLGYLTVFAPWLTLCAPIFECTRRKMSNSKTQLLNLYTHFFYKKYTQHDFFFGGGGVGGYWGCKAVSSTARLNMLCLLRYLKASFYPFIICSYPQHPSAIFIRLWRLAWKGNVSYQTRSLSVISSTCMYRRLSRGIYHDTDDIKTRFSSTKKAHNLTESTRCRSHQFTSTRTWEGLTRGGADRRDRLRPCHRCVCRGSCSWG